MPTVILLHGIWMRAGVTGRLAARLRAAGYAVHSFDYASIQSTFAEHHERIDRLVDSVDGALHLVGHSLGGVLALDYLNRSPQRAARVGRVVCLGSPLNGSALAQRLKRVRLDTLGLGFASKVLVDGVPPWAGPQAVGVIAGEISFGLSLLLGPLPRPNDGTVAVAETRLPGIADHVTVRASHTALLFSEHAATLTMNFLREGRFACVGDTRYRC
jgi:pimeloyl-ACP methyl ester carboxylesterase